MKGASTVVLATCVLAGACARDGDAQSARRGDWRSEWATRAGLSLTTDTEGYELPTVVAFVPRPGAAPSDPLYFVGELRGRVKVVTNDRTVHVFAEGFLPRRVERELPDPEGETGLGGLCLDPDHGFVFVTYAYTDSAGALRNAIRRFESRPGTFGLHAGAGRDLAPVLAREATALSHQIGGCHVDHGLLYVGVGDGRQTRRSRDPRSVLGKVLRLTLDGEPAPGNPLSRDDAAAAPLEAPPYVWALGLRNPFGLTVVDGRLFVVDNGNEIDRFIEVERGADYLWSGNDLSIGSRADAVFAPSVGPAHVAWVPPDAPWAGPRLAGRFAVGLSSPYSPGVLVVPYELVRRTMAAPPERVLGYRGSGRQIVGGVAAGPDGLYVAPILPDAGGASRILRLAHDDAREHPHRLEGAPQPAALFRDRGCIGCHRLGIRGGTEGPDLNSAVLTARLEQRLNDPAYHRTLAELDRQRWGAEAGRRARAAVGAQDGRARALAWTAEKILDPGFDNPRTQMPDLGLARSDAEALAAYLLPPPPGLAQRAAWAIEARLPNPFHARHAVALVVLGFAAGAFVTSAGYLMRRRTEPRGAARPTPSHDSEPRQTGR